MPLEQHTPSNNLLAVIGRNILKRFEMPIPSYEKRIINNLDNRYRLIQPGMCCWSKADPN